MTHPMLTEEMCKAALAAYRKHGYEEPCGAGLVAALSAALPLIGEACAGVYIKVNLGETDDYLRGFHDGSQAMVTAIRQENAIG